jgi:hypothetical protein
VIGENCQDINNQKGRSALTERPASFSESQLRGDLFHEALSPICSTGYIWPEDRTTGTPLERLRHMNTSVRSDSNCLVGLAFRFTHTCCACHRAVTSHCFDRWASTPGMRRFVATDFTPR